MTVINYWSVVQEIWDAGNGMGMNSSTTRIIANFTTKEKAEKYIQENKDKLTWRTNMGYRGADLIIEENELYLDEE